MTIAGFSVLLAAVFIIPVALVLVYFRLPFHKTGKIMDKYAGSKESNSLFIKKYNEASVNYYRSVFLLIGLAVSLGSLLLSFNYIAPEEDLSIETIAVVDEEEVEDIPQTNQTKPPPPPPPPPPEVIEVEDDIEIEEEPEIFEQEIDDEMEIEEPIVFEEPEIVEEVVKEPEIFLVVEEMPEFPNGEKAMYEYLYKKIKYPQVAKENGIEGKVYVQFVVDENGRVINAVVKRGIGGGCDEEALKAVESMPSWKPGKQRGKPVRVKFTIPIHFTLE